MSSHLWLEFDMGNIQSRRMQNDKCEVEVFSPAKINLVLSVTDRRPDGYHNLVSLVAKLAWGDNLCITWDKCYDGISLTCNNPQVPLDDENLIIKVVKLFRESNPFEGGISFHLEKRIPMGGGLGGGSSNAIAALKGLNLLFNKDYEIDQFIGSDCKIFEYEGVVEVCGRGELVKSLGEDGECFKGKRVLVFTPNFGVNTAWAYGEFKKNPKYYLCEKKGLEKIAQIKENLKEEVPWESMPFYNNFEQVLMEKHLVYPALKSYVRDYFHLGCYVSGSGSSCFVPLPDEFDALALKKFLRDVLGENVFMVETTIS